MAFGFSSIEKHLPNWLLPSVLIISAVLNLIGSIYDTVKLQPTIKNLNKEIDKLTNEVESLKTQNELIVENVKNVFDNYLQNVKDVFDNYLQNVKDVFDNYLHRLSLKLEFGKNNHNNERATIYLHDSVSHFIPFGRFSANPKYCKKGRTQYPDNEGCIAKGWENSWHFDNNLGKGDDTYKRNNLKKYHIDNKTIDNDNEIETLCRKTYRCR